jgi:hypothetical protein
MADSLTSTVHPSTIIMINLAGGINTIKIDCIGIVLIGHQDLAKKPEADHKIAILVISHCK